MKILFDGRAYQFQKAGGINRYFAEIIGGLPPDWVPTVTGVRDFGENIPRHSNLRVKNPPLFRPIRFRHHIERHWWCPHVARSIDLLHPTYYDLTSGFQLSDFKCPVVTTVYDMIYARFPEQMEGSAETIRMQRESVIRADRVICISRSTEQDLLEFIPEAAGKTRVIYLGSTFSVREGVNEEELFENPTFLFVGGRHGYKNFLFLLQAFAKAASVVPGIRLTVAGPPFTSEERWQMHFMGISDKVTSVVFPHEAALESLYQKSVALLYPSRYEGFGIPPLEAMACGTIAVTANTTSLPEVIGDCGVMLDPTDENLWIDCMVKLSRPFPERRKLQKLGYDRIKRFNWQECVRRHLEIYREVTTDLNPLKDFGQRVA